MEEPIAEEEKESANEDPSVKFKPVFNLPEVSVKLNRQLFYSNGLTKATKKKARDADLKGGYSPPVKRRRITWSTAKGVISSDCQVPDDEVNRFLAEKKIGRPIRK